ncbi:permease [Paenibacillus pini JCM 16418]|uniref:Permease n=2 Tax=Paenibacillus TaxID=44249 RepID=W7YYF3_9BACL|nr:permease [Paenibacillus pini JCM 16418]
MFICPHSCILQFTSPSLLTLYTTFLLICSTKLNLFYSSTCMLGTGQAGRGMDMIIFNYVLMCLIFGTTFLAIKVGIDASTPPFFSAGIRFFIAGLVLFLWMVWKGKARFSLLLQKEMLISGLCLTFGTFAMLYWAEQHVSSGIAAVLSATGPLMMLLIQIIFLRQKVTLRSILGCIVGFIGVVLMLLSSINISTDVWWMLGMGAILIGEIGYASGALYSKRVIQNMPKASPVALNAAQMIYGGFSLSYCLYLQRMCKWVAFLIEMRLDRFFT